MFAPTLIASSSSICQMCTLRLNWGQIVSKPLLLLVWSVQTGDHHKDSNFYKLILFLVWTLYSVLCSFERISQSVMCSEKTRREQGGIRADSCYWIESDTKLTAFKLFLNKSHIDVYKKKIMNI